MVANTSRKDYFVANAMELTPHPNQRLVSVLGEPIMDRRLKYTVVETAVTGSSATSTTPTALISINQGTTDITRTGDRIRLKRIWLSGKVYGNASQTGPVSARLVLALWNPVGAAAANAPVASQVIQASTGYQPYGSYSRDYGDSYQIVYDAVFSVNALAAAAEAELFHLDRAVTVDMEFNAGGTTPVTNNLYLWLMTDVGANQPAANLQFVGWFEDLDA